MSEVWTFHSAGQIVFGPRAAAQVGQIATRIGLQRVFIVTDQALIAAGLLGGVRGSLVEAGIAVDVFDGGEPEPSLAVGEACIEQARRCNADGILGLGGGSNMDLAKAAATVIAHGGAIRDYVGDDQVPGPVLPLICLPTTAGTGSEVTFAAVLTDTENELKIPILSNYIRPAVAIVDPQLTLSCPPKVTADSGIDALTHAIEAYTAIDNRQFPLPAGEESVYQGCNPLSECLAEKAITLIDEHLVQAVSEPNNLAAREGMALAATLAGLAFANSGVALVHALQAAVGGATHSSHGAGNGLLLPYVMRFNLPACLTKTAQIAKLLGCDLDGLTQDEAAEQAVEAVQDLARQIGIPQQLRELGLSADQIPTVAEKAFQAKRILRVNPREISLSEMEEILHAAQ
ncbi:MAG: iron-containing alcohol dehydrogenase [Pirellulaceae bacterium]|nr:iron-containing alcohol dehydrogenase [Pirellulaceae bacterium]